MRYYSVLTGLHASRRVLVMSEAQEYQAVHQQAGLIDCAMMGVLEITGTDRVAFLHNLLTNDIKRLALGTGCEAALVTPVAKLIAHLLVLADQDRHWLVTDRACVDAVLTTLGHYLITEDVAIHDRRTAYTVLALQGPSIQPLAQQLGTALNHRVLDIDGTAIRHIAFSCTGEPGVLLLVPTDRKTQLWDALTKRAQPVGRDTFNILRLEAGLPWYGMDMDETTLFPETGLQTASVSCTKGCYVGQEVIARLDTQGSLSRKLVGLRLEGSLVPDAGDGIEQQGQAIGTITSSGYSPTLQCPIALGYVKRPHYETGTKITVIHAGQQLGGTIVERPFVR